MERILGWFAGHHVTANLLMALILVGGILSVLSFKVEIFPEIEPERVVVTIPYPGASPKEVEDGVLKEVEEAISGIDGVKEITSYATEGMATVEVEAIRGWDIKELRDDIEAEVMRLTNLPEEAERPVIREFVRRVPVLNVAIYGDLSPSALKELAEDVKEGITALPGVTEVEIHGVPERELSIEVGEETLREYGLSLMDVADAVRRWSLDLPAGNIRSPEGHLLLRTKEKRFDVKGYRDVVVISRVDGARVRLGDIATIRDTFEETDLLSRFNGKRAVSIWVYRVGDQNALTIAQRVRDYVEELKGRLPEGVGVEIFGDRSEILKARLTLLLKNMSYGMVLVVLILGLFMNPRLSFWVTMGIPTAFAFALWLLPSYGVSINMVSLFAFIMVLGIVVDDAIVIGENTFRKRREGLPPLRAAVEGSVEVARPVIFSVLTTMAAFWPLLLGSGTIGKIMRQIPIVVILVLAGSLVEALLILPAHLARSRYRGEESRKERLVEGFLAWLIDGPYRRLLSLCLRWRYVTVSAGMALLLVSLGLWLGGRVKFTFFPTIESDIMTAYVTMPPGTPSERTLEVVRHLEDAAMEAAKERGKTLEKPLIRYIYSSIGERIRMGPRPDSGSGGSGGHLGQVLVQLVGAEERPDVSTGSVASLWREKAGTMPQAESISFESQLFRAGKAVEVELSMEDEGRLLNAAEDLKGELSRYPGVYDIEDSHIPGKEELRVKLKPGAEGLGLSPEDVARQIRASFYGLEALRIQRGRDELKVMVRYPREERMRLSSLMDMRITTRQGLKVPIGEVVEIERSRGNVTITRKDRERVITVGANVDESRTNAEEVRRHLMEEVMPALSARYPGLRYRLTGEGEEEAEAMADVIRGFLLALTLIYILLAIPLDSFSQPILIMAAIPFGIIGAIAGHLIMGMNMSIMSLFGIVGLSGVVVNDSLILFDRINRFRREGCPVEEAILEGTKRRFRAVILTTLTTFGGLFPLIMERSLQAQFLIPMALSLAFGILFATLITLLLLPCGYRIMEDLRSLRTPAHL